MNTNELSTVNTTKSVFTVKNVLRAFALLVIIFAFCPSFLVSCSGQEINVNVMTAVKGYSSYGETIVKPHFIMLLCILIPVAILVLLFVKKFTDEKTAAIILISAACDFVIWLIFRNKVKAFAEESYCDFETTAGFWFNIISLLLLVVFSAAVVLKKLQMDSDLLSLLSGGGTKDALNQMSKAVGQMSNTVSKMAADVVSNVGNKPSNANTIGFCSKCGSAIPYGCKFCTSCGTAVPEQMLAEAEAARSTAENTDQ